MVMKDFDVYPKAVLPPHGKVTISICTYMKLTGQVSWAPAYLGTLLSQHAYVPAHS